MAYQSQSGDIVETYVQDGTTYTKITRTSAPVTTSTTQSFQSSSSSYGSSETQSVSSASYSASSASSAQDSSGYQKQEYYYSSGQPQVYQQVTSTTTYEQPVSVSSTTLYEQKGSEYTKATESSSSTSSYGTVYSGEQSYYSYGSYAQPGPGQYQPPPPVIPSQPYPDGVFYIRIGQWVLQPFVDQSGNPQLGAPVILAELKTQASVNQLWSYESGFIVHRKTGLVLDIAGASFRSGSKITVYSRKAVSQASNQLWTIEKNGFISSQSQSKFVLTIDQDGLPLGAGLVIKNRQEANVRNSQWIYLFAIHKETRQRIYEVTENIEIDFQEWYRSEEWTTTSQSQQTVSEKSKFSTGAKIGMAIGGGVLATGAALLTAKLVTDKQKQDAEEKARREAEEKARQEAEERTRRETEERIRIETEERTRRETEERIRIETEERTKRETEERTRRETEERTRRETEERRIREEQERRQSSTTVSTGPIPSVPSDQTIPDGYFFIRIGNYVLQPLVSSDDAIAQPGTAVILAELKKTVTYNQLWTHENGFIIHRKTGLVLDVSGGNFTSGNKITVYNRKELSQAWNQTWNIESDGRISSKSQPDFVLTIDQNDLPRSAGLVIRKRQEISSRNTSWVLLVIIHKVTRQRIIEITEFQNIEVEEWYTVVRRTSTVTTTTTTSTSGGGELVPTGNFFIKIGRYVLEVDSRSAKAGSTVVIGTLRKNKVSYGQLWSYDNGYIVHLKTGLVLDIRGGKFYSGATIQLHNRKGGSTQLWTVNSDGTISCKTQTEYVLAIEEDDIPDGAELVIRKRTDIKVKNTIWKFLIIVSNKRRVFEVTENQTIEVEEWSSSYSSTVVSTEQSRKTEDWKQEKERKEWREREERERREREEREQRKEWKEREERKERREEKGCREERKERGEERGCREERKERREEKEERGCREERKERREEKEERGCKGDQRGGRREEREERGGRREEREERGWKEERRESKEVGRKDSKSDQRGGRREEREERGWKEEKRESKEVGRKESKDSGKKSSSSSAVSSSSASSAASSTRTQSSSRVVGYTEVEEVEVVEWRVSSG